MPGRPSLSERISNLRDDVTAWTDASDDVAEKKRKAIVESATALAGDLADAGAAADALDAVWSIRALAMEANPGGDAVQDLLDQWNRRRRSGVQAPRWRPLAPDAESVTRHVLDLRRAAQIVERNAAPPLTPRGAAARPEEADDDADDQGPTFAKTPWRDLSPAEQMQREEHILATLEALEAREVEPPSWRALSRDVGISVPTLKSRPRIQEAYLNCEKAAAEAIGARRARLARATVTIDGERRRAAN